MNDSAFDPASFLDATTTDASVKRPPLPPGDYTAITGQLTSKAWESKKPEAKIKSGIKFEVPLSLEVPLAVQEQLGLGPTLSFTDSIMLEVTEQGGIDYSPGKNGGLRRYRDACNCNQAGQPFSPRMLEGKAVKVKIGHKVYEGEVYDEIQGVAKA